MPRVAGDGVDPGGERQLLGRDLVAHRLDRVRLRPDEGDALLFQRRAERRVFRQEAVARVHRLGAGVPARLHDAVDHEVALRRRRRPDQDCLVGEFDVAGALVRFRVDGDGADAHPLRGPDHATGDFAAVGDEDFLEHAGVLFTVGVHSGMLLCLRHGFSTFFSRSIASDRQIRLRVSCGMMTSSM